MPRHSPPLPRRAARARHAAVLAPVALLAAAAPLAAQGRLDAARTAGVGPVFESWSFGDGLTQPLFSGADAVRVRRASRFAIPLAASVPLGARFGVDVSGAYTSGRVELASSADAIDGVRTLDVSGLTDTKVRLTGRLANDNLGFTVGLNAPTGRTELSARELEALRVVAAPALGFAAPTLGNGAGGTAGLVYARDVRGYAMALGASYERRTRYTPAATIAGGLPAFGYTPSDAVHLSLALDGTVREHGLTLGMSADLYGEDRFTSRGAPDATVPDALVPSTSTARLGPVLTLEGELRVATTRLRELTLYVVDRYRTPYQRGGATVAASAGNYLDAGVRAVFPVGARLGLLTAASLRHQTGLRSDTTLAAAAMAAGGLTVGLTRDFQSGFTLQPFVRGQVARIESGVRNTGATSIAAGIGVTRRF
jgi:hypothetical protein